MKADIRREMKVRRASQDPVLAAAASIAAQDRLCGLEAFIRARRVACYLSAPGELGTAKLLQACFKDGKMVTVPARRGTTWIYGLCRMTPDTPLRVGLLGITEPAVPEWVDAGEMDLVVVPGVAFDARGNRLGHGLGCYDRMLAGEGRAFKAAIAFDWQLVHEVPMESHDVPMDAVVTERTIYATGSGAGPDASPISILNKPTTTMGKGCIS